MAQHKSINKKNKRERNEILKEIKKFSIYFSVL